MSARATSSITGPADAPPVHEVAASAPARNGNRA